MKMTDGFLRELEMEIQTTRRVLDRVPEDKLGWRPHPNSHSLGQLALHIAGSIGTVAQMVTLESKEMPSFQQPEATSRKEIFDALDASLNTARETLANADEAMLLTDLPILKNGETVMRMPRLGLIRSLMLNHQYHHRGQLTVYLRLLSVPVPSVYGPSADEGMPSQG